MATGPAMPEGVTVNGKILSVPCPECGSALILKPSKFGWFFGCEKWRETGCDGSVGCHPNSKIPLGIPAPKTVKRLRIQAHKAFDRLWKNGRMTRKAAYHWMREKMSLTSARAHIGMFTDEQCKQLVELVMNEVPYSYMDEGGKT